ncbi:hypothetical protein [Companilactobacillus mishanensis]|uniref:Acetyl-CoA carboxylase n=1 Tax=Companilactobacillus mishanensis TaxID=2486008 RepID=A0A5P0ZGS1_9LACO|nr:hypothetical protein [Companilactobacillus mishanensis]MQS52185.1 hypothetical protein [Companilactobacillus mishanensis]
MIKESRILIENYDKKFLRKYKWRYHLLVVDNKLFHCYSFFLQAYRQGDNLNYSYDLLDIPHKEGMYRQVLADLKKHSKLWIEYRDTDHLVRPGEVISEDLHHGHY